MPVPLIDKASRSQSKETISRKITRKNAKIIARRCNRTLTSNTLVQVSQATKMPRIFLKRKEALSSLMSNFEGLLKGTVGDYKKM